MSAVGKIAFPESILAEIKTLLKNGCQQITLLGENVNSYAYGNLNFVGLLKQIVSLPGSFRVFFVTSHPKDFAPDFN